jgi:Pyridoxamine 5'-phosphate oxidase
MQPEYITNENDLRNLYAQPIERVRLKTLRKLDGHCRSFVARSPFLCLGTHSARGSDVTPRGDEPGFVHVIDETTLAIPDWPGNNRLDSFSNIVLNGEVATAVLYSRRAGDIARQWHGGNYDQGRVAESLGAAWKTSEGGRGGHGSRGFSPLWESSDSLTLVGGRLQDQSG